MREAVAPLTGDEASPDLVRHSRVRLVATLAMGAPDGSPRGGGARLVISSHEKEREGSNGASPSQAQGHPGILLMISTLRALRGKRVVRRNCMCIPSPETSGA